MKLDLTIKEHRDAVLWACHRARMRDAVLTADPVKLAAEAAIQDPAALTDLLRQVLDRCSINADAHALFYDRIEVVWNEPDATDISYRLMHLAGVMIALPDILRLDPPNREKALEILRGAA